jgi:hypothetical protein
VDGKTKDSSPDSHDKRGWLGDEAALRAKHRCKEYKEYEDANRAEKPRFAGIDSIRQA